MILNWCLDGEQCEEGPGRPAVTTIIEDSSPSSGESLTPYIKGKASRDRDKERKYLSGNQKRALAKAKKAEMKNIEVLSINSLLPHL